MVSNNKVIKGVTGVGSSCTKTATEAANGASLELSESPATPGKVIFAGVVPDGVGSVASPISASQRVTVHDNAWSLEVSTATTKAAKAARLRATRRSHRQPHKQH